MTRHDDSLDAPVRRAAAQGIGAAFIARELGVTPNRVHAVLARLRRNGEVFPRVRPGPALRLQGLRLSTLDGVTRRAFEPHAAAREVSIRQLVHLILRTVARDDLVDAILDDKETNP